MSKNTMTILMNHSGSTREIKLLSGLIVTIREQNGDDDGIISKLKDARTGENISKFLSSIIIAVEGKEKVLPYGEIDKWKVSDKYYLMLASRILSIGADLHFDHKCQNALCKKTTAYDEDLNTYMIPGDDSTEEEKEGFNNNPYAPKRYPFGQDKTREFTLRSGKVVRYNYLDSLSERSVFTMDPEESNVNLEYTKRGLQLNHNGKWQSISSFGIFSSPDMIDLRTDLKRHDPVFEALSSITCPHCGQEVIVALVALTDFFYPVLI